MKETYDVRITMQDGGGLINDEYRAVVTRNIDSEELVYSSRWRWLLKLKLNRQLLDRAFKYHDKRAKKLAHEEWTTR